MIKIGFSAALFFSALIDGGFVFPAIADAVTVTETTAPDSPSNTSQSRLPHCVNVDSDIATMESMQKVNGKTARKYDGYRELLQADTPLELATRLAYAETLAANCPDQQDEVLDLVAGVIGNRVRIRGGDVSHVVFQKNQFASSLNIYAESRYRDFLCPNNQALWQQALMKTRANFAASQTDIPLPVDAVNYYLYRHSGRFNGPNWQLDEAPISDAKTRECIRVFRDPRWR